MSQITVQHDHQSIQLPAGSTGTDLFGDDATIIAMTVNGVEQDLFRELHDGAEVTPIHKTDPAGLAIMRHSAAHVLAQAVQQAHPEAKLGIGPPIMDGFYYDFDVETPFTPDDLKAFEKAMQRIINEGQTFHRVEIDDDEARVELAEEPYKLELIDLKGSAANEDTEGANVEVGGDGLTIYQNIRRDGSVAWQDLCRGPHVPSTKILGNAFKLTRVAAAYWRGQETNDQLQRIYGTAWASKDDLKAYLDRLAEAERRDHRKLGAELDLFSFPDEVGSGLPVFHPKGGIIRAELEEYSRQQHVKAGYSFVNTPHITKANLFETSGHLQWYKDGMFPPMQLEAEFDEDGNLTKPGQDYYLKPMNCPFHHLIYRSQGRSYRDLPMRLFEFGTVYRYEKSGVVHGLTRVRGLTQDDAHIYCTQEQIHEEITSILQFVLNLLRDYGLDDFYLELSTKDESKYVGDDEMWDSATATLAQVAADSGLELVPDPGGAAFYGPKISVQARDAIGRSWQMSTIQLDFNMPERFDLQYTAADGTRKQPVLIHRALFGSIERFFGVLTEHYAGAFPPWLAPVQVLGLPVADEYNDYLADILDELRQQGVRGELDDSDDRFGKKIRNASKQKVPFVLIAGEEDRAAGAVSFRYRDGSQENGIPRAVAVEKIMQAIAERVQV